MEDVYNDVQSELNVLSRTPVSFIVFGKPGCGKTTLARRLASVWKCQFVNEVIAIEELLKESSPFAKKVHDILAKGSVLDETLMAEIIHRKLESPEAQHYGYVLDCFPSYSNTWKTVTEQLDFIKGLDQSPDIVINLKIPDIDLLKRRVGQKVDPLTNEVFVKSSYAPDIPNSNADASLDMDEMEEEEEIEGEEGEEGDGGEEGETEEDEFTEDLGELDELQSLAPDIADRLITRSNDKPTVVEKEIAYYKHHMLRHIEDYIIQHSRQYVIELDANLPPKQLFHNLLVHLTFLGLPRAVAPKRLVLPEDGVEDDETIGMDTDQFLTQLSGTGTLDSHFRWRRSQWSRYCPVELANGNLVQGQTEFSVGLLDKMYCLSSTRALVEFYKCPRKYLLFPNPRVPCKVCVLGPPSSGKSALATRIAQHYNAMVINADSLLVPVMEKANEIALSEAKEKVKEEVLARLTIEQNSKKETEQETTNEPITEDHPDVQEAMNRVEQQTKPLEPSIENYVDALSEGVKMAEARRMEDANDGRCHGGWVIDGFPSNRSHWSAMIDAELLPDVVISLENSNKDKDLLMERFCKDNSLPDPSTWEQKEPDSPKPPVPPEVQKWQKQYTDYTQQWNMLSEAIKGSSIDPVSIDYSVTIEEALKSAIKGIESVFSFPAVEPDEDAEVDDDHVTNEDPQDEEDEEMASKKKKPWGDTSYYCPVALKEMDVLWPGSLETSIRYKDRLYAFSSDEAKEKFTDKPDGYVAIDNPLKVPPTRILLLGPRGSGKTTVGRQLAAKTGIFHISFHHYLQDLIMPKMKKPPLVDKDDFEDGKDSEQNDDEEDNASNGDLDDDVAEALNDKETEIRSYLLNGEQLQEDTLESLVAPFWNQEPYKSTGFMLEGFPTQSDELRYVCSKGLFPDTVAVLETEIDDIVDRLMPEKMEIWTRKRNKTLQIRSEKRQKVLREWEEDKAKRRAEIDEDYKQKKAQSDEEMMEAGDDDDEEVEDAHDPLLDEYQDQIAELEGEEQPEEEEYEDEGEEEFRERTVNSLKEKIDEQNDNINAIKEVLAELQIPFHAIQGTKKPSIVQYCVQKALYRFLFNREGLLTKCTIIDKPVAKKLIDHGYKQLSKFGYWCPVKLLEDPNTVLPPSNGMIPTAYRGRMYYLSSRKVQSDFETNPGKYLSQQVPSLPVPVRIAVVGPPKSGKTTVAKRFCHEYGCIRLSIGEAMRKVIADNPESDLTAQIISHLKKGQAVPDELCVLALERVLLNIQCSTRGFVFDGWPMTKAQVDLLNKYQIIPIAFAELKVSNETLLTRAEIDRNSKDRLYPVHDSPSILMVRSGSYHKHMAPIKEWYSIQHDNWYTVDGERNMWHVWRDSQNVALNCALQIQHYLLRVIKGQAASIFSLCITPKDFSDRLGSFQNYCPVCLKENVELVECSEQPNLKCAVEYMGYYYRTCNESHCDYLLNNPDEYLSEDNCLPSVDRLPKRVSEVAVKQQFPKRYELQGFCPVTYVDGKERFDYLVPGTATHSVEYENKLYCCESEDKLTKFLRSPFKYDKAVLPVKLPPIKQQLSIPNLPMLGYLEQSVAVCIINGLTAVGCFKPKFPFISASQSAQLYLALHLKAYNPNSSRYTREKYRKRLQKFEKQCHMIPLLMNAMKYKDTQKTQNPDFETHMKSFLALAK